jgi:hypothetical protein
VLALEMRRSCFAFAELAGDFGLLRAQVVLGSVQSGRCFDKLRLSRWSLAAHDTARTSPGDGAEASRANERAQKKIDHVSPDISRQLVEGGAKRVFLLILGCQVLWPGL